MSGFAIRPRNLTALAVVLILVVMLSLLPLPAARATEDNARAVILVLEDVQLRDIDQDETPNLFRLLRTGSAGLISFRKAFNLENVRSAFYSTIGAGAPATGLEQKDFIVSGSKRPLSPADPRLSARAAEIKKTNNDRSIHASFGALGTALRRQGLKTSGVGSAGGTDFLDAIVDENGRLDRLVILEDRPPGSANRTAFEGKLFSDWTLKLYTDSALTIAALNLTRDDLPKTREAGRNLGAKALSAADQITGDLMRGISEEDLLIVLMPFNGAPVNHYTIAGNLISSGEPLSPIAIRGPGFRGSLTSATTRQTGLVGAADIAPTILNHLGVESINQLRGRTINSSESDIDARDLLVSIDDRALRHDALLLPVLVPVSLYGIAVLLVTLISIWRRNRAHDRLLRTAIISLFLLPPALSFPLIADLGQMWAGPATIAVVLALAFPLTAVPKRKIVPLLLASGLTPILFTADILSGSRFADLSMLRASLLTGGRYYGVGNPLFGLLFIFTVLFFTSIVLLWPTIRQRLVFRLGFASTLTLILLVVGAARFGANFGGLITLVIAWPYLFLLLIGRERIGRLRILAGLSAALALALVLYDMALGSAGQSHIGRTFTQLGTDPIYLFDMLKTKVSYNLEVAYLVLFRWGGILIAGVMAALIFTVRARLSAGLEDFLLFKRVIPGILVGAISAFLLNDTGFEPLLIILLYTLAAATYLYLAVEDLSDPDIDGARRTNNERMFA